MTTRRYVGAGGGGDPWGQNGAKPAGWVVQLVRPPHGRKPVLGGLVKGIFDGVICAFQAHTDAAVLPEAWRGSRRYLRQIP
jgi:hypothetical protein